MLLLFITFHSILIMVLWSQTVMRISVWKPDWANAWSLIFHTQPPQMGSMGMMNPPTMMYTQPVMRPPNPFGSVSSAQVGVCPSVCSQAVFKHFSAWVNWCIHRTVKCAILWCVSFIVDVRAVEDDDSFNNEPFTLWSWRRQKKTVDHLPFGLPVPVNPSLIHHSSSKLISSLLQSLYWLWLLLWSSHSLY